MKKLFFTLQINSEDAKELGVQPGFNIYFGREIMERLIQEEIWATTSWPEDEPILDDLCFVLNKHPI